jgi:hypothetical protein
LTFSTKVFICHFPMRARRPAILSLQEQGVANIRVPVSQKTDDTEESCKTVTSPAPIPLCWSVVQRQTRPRQRKTAEARGSNVKGRSWVSDSACSPWDLPARKTSPGNQSSNYFKVVGASDSSWKEDGAERGGGGAISTRREKWQNRKGITRNSFMWEIRISSALKNDIRLQGHHKNWFYP